MRKRRSSVLDLFERLDAVVVRWMSRWGILLLRAALGMIFIWFGGLKIFRVSPVSDLVAQTVYWVSPKFFVPFLGVWELIVGLGLLFGICLRTVLFLFFLQMAGTFLVLVMRPEVAFQGGNPLLLTTVGEFVVKNTVLISAGLVIGSTVRRSSSKRER